MPNGSEIYSEDGGRYNMTIHYSHGKGRQIEVDVNGIITKISSLGEDDNHSQISIPVELKAGYNTIRIGNSYRIGHQDNRLLHIDKDIINCNSKIKKKVQKRRS